MTDSPRRHWSDHPKGVHADRQWRSEPSAQTAYSDEEVYWTSDPPSDLLRVANVLPFRPYVYGASRLSLRPEVDDFAVTIDLRREETKRRKPWKPKQKPQPVPDTYVPPDPPPVPVDEHPPCSNPDCDDPLYCHHPWERPVDIEKWRLERENQELKERIARLEAERPVPLFVKPFVCSSCDPASPLFTPTHGQCPAGDCACYQQTPDLHDRNKRLEKQQ